MVELLACRRAALQVSPAAQPWAPPAVSQYEVHRPPDALCCKQSMPSPHMVMPGVLTHALPFAPPPLGRHAKFPDVSLTAHVCPAGHAKGFAAQPGSSAEDDEEHATTKEPPPITTSKSEGKKRMARTLA